MANATLAGITVTRDGKEYEFSPLGFEDLEYLELWLRSRAIEAGRMSLPAGLTQSERDEMMRPIIQEANKINILISFSSVLTPSGVVRMIHRMLRRKHPEVPLEELCRWVEDKDFMHELMPKLDLLVPGKDEKKGGPARNGRSPRNHRIVPRSRKR